MLIAPIPGNRCWHNPKKPKFYIPPENQKRYHVLKEGARRSIACYKNPYLHSAMPLAFHPKAETKAGRKRKSESREVIFTQIIPLLLHYLDLASMKFGMLHQLWGYKMIARKLGLEHQRVSRAMRVMQRLGLIEVTPITKNCDGKVRTVGVIIVVTEKLFTIFDLNRQLTIDRERALAKQWKKEDRVGIVIQSEAREFKRKTYNAFYRHKTKQQKKEERLSIAEKKQLSEMAIQFHKQDPLKTISEYYQELERLTLERKNKSPPH